jgi:DNA-binding SARP family transcriptional activator
MTAAAPEIRVLGPFEVSLGGRSVPLRAYKPRALLAILLLRRGESVSGDRLIDDLWGAESPPSARHALQVYVSQLRGALPPGALVTDDVGYRLELDADRVDAARFERLVAEGRRALADRDAEGAVAALEAALELWRGPALVDFTYEPFAQAEIVRLEELRLEATELRIDAALTLARPGLVAELEGLVSEHPLRERLRGQLMVALYRDGRQADALDAYRAARTALVEGLGVEPGPALRELEGAVLRQDPSLSLAPPTAPEPRRKLATVLSADLADSSSLAAGLDPEAFQDVLLRWLEAVSAVLAEHGGTAGPFTGASVLGIFGTQVAHEDDALRAVRAASALRQAAAALEDADGAPLAVQIGVASGEVLTGDQPLPTGPAVTVAGALLRRAGSGEIVVDDLTRRLTAGAADYEELGETGATAFRLAELRPAATTLVRRLDLPLVDRTRELEALSDAFEQALLRRTATAVLVHGPAGIGKTRLAGELTATVDARVLAGHCAAYGEGGAFEPLREAVGSREAALETMGAAPDAQAVADRLGVVLGGEGSIDEVPWAFRRYCELLAAERPLVVVLDDLHWAEPALLDLVEHVAARAHGPIALVCLARDDLLEERLDFLCDAVRVPLEPLARNEAEQLAAMLLADKGLPAETRDRLVATAEGNPLFLEQLIAHAAETGSAEPAPTLRALLAARLDRVGPGERAVLERAAVVGRHADVGEIAALLEPAAAARVREHAATLARRGFFRDLHGHTVHFRHGLIQDAVYRGTPKAVRAELHERFADLLDRRGADDERVGFHLEQAYRLRAELTPDRHALRLAEDAGDRLGKAGIKAAKRSDARAAVDLLDRATALLPESDQRRRRLLCELAVGLSTMREVERAANALEAARKVAVAAGDRAVELRASIELLVNRVDDDPSAASDFERLATESIPVLLELRDDRALGRTWMHRAWIHGGFLCRYALSADYAEKARGHYVRAGWPTSACVAQTAAALFSGPVPVPDAIDRCTALLEKVEDLAGVANARTYLGGLVAMQGRFSEGLELVTKAREGFEDLGHIAAVAHACGPVAASIRLLEGDVAAAERELRETCTALVRMHDSTLLATHAASLADVQLHLGMEGEAAASLRLAEEHAVPYDVSASLTCRSVRARLLAAAGETVEAEELARSAVALADTTDALNDRAAVRLALAFVLRAAGRLPEASAELELAIAELELKGNVVGSGRARELLEGLRLDVGPRQDRSPTLRGR